MPSDEGEILLFALLVVVLTISLFESSSEPYSTKSASTRVDLVLCLPCYVNKNPKIMFHYQIIYQPPDIKQLTWHLTGGTETVDVRILWFNWGQFSAMPSIRILAIHVRSTLSDILQVNGLRENPGKHNWSASHPHKKNTKRKHNETNATHQTFDLPGLRIEQVSFKPLLWENGVFNGVFIPLFIRIESVNVMKIR